MQPNIISRHTLTITGISGNGSDTGKVWEAFTSRYDRAPFDKADNYAYEIRFYDGEKPAEAGKDIHVGYFTETNENNGHFTTAELPPTEYAVFDVYVANGYDSENKTMDKWLSDHCAEYGRRLLNGVGYIVECYNEKFKGGDKPDSVVEIWIPFFRYCQSCGMPLMKDEDFGTDADGGRNTDYCCHCFGKGAFFKEESMKDMIETCIPFVSQGNPYSDAEQARKAMREVFPKLKRWKTGL